MLEIVLYGDLAVKTGSSTLAGKTSRVPGGQRDLSTVLEQIDSDDEECGTLFIDKKRTSLYY